MLILRACPNPRGLACTHTQTMSLCCMASSNVSSINLCTASICNKTASCVAKDLTKWFTSWGWWSKLLSQWSLGMGTTQYDITAHTFYWYNWTTELDLAPLLTPTSPQITAAATTMCIKFWPYLRVSCSYQGSDKLISQALTSTELLPLPHFIMSWPHLVFLTVHS